MAKDGRKTPPRRRKPEKSRAKSTSPPAAVARATGAAPATGRRARRRPVASGAAEARSPERLPEVFRGHLARLDALIAEVERQAGAPTERSGQIAVIAERALDGYAELARWAEDAFRGVAPGGRSGRDTPAPSSWLEMLGSFPPLAALLPGETGPNDAEDVRPSAARGGLGAILGGRVRSLLAVAKPADPDGRGVAGTKPKVKPANRRLRPRAAAPPTPKTRRRSPGKS
ncbi:MAG: hypothetical protein RL698_512 [Pseudomonadota bacterium]|jgi:hypothetical protein